ncbi:MAG: helix-hairpin-helix domain-containing protein [Candidatus Cloacimonadaceae bacterium]|nr:helix-hairpin-helix domain-containing protein [Candidatus Cloacimonadaceae bacterium]MDP3114231.1 helix-hairpin-helix domain-containing protein [Candidatus Cloacimonadaceae bacterium]
MKKLLILLFALCAMGLFAEKVDLNSADFGELMRLPISEKQARDILEYREYVAYFKNLFELRKIPSIDQKTLLRIRDLVVVSLYRESDDAAVRREEIRDLLERLDSNEGASEGMADVWMDYLMTPQNVNRMHFDDLISLPNVSPVDAVAILKRIARGDSIADMRDMRNSVGLSHYGYTNLRSYVYYTDPPVRNRMMYDAQLQYYTRYFEEGQYDMLHESFLRSGYGNASVVIPHNKNLAYWGYFNLDRLDPDVLMKLRMRYGNNYKTGFINYTSKAEPGLQTKTASEIIADSKFYAGYENDALSILDNTRLKLYLGHYRVTYGEGLVMENTDFYSARKTGYGFSKRILGITPDLSRTQEFALRGAAVELTHPVIGISAWVSQDNKDAIVYVDQSGETLQINGRDKIFSYVVPSIRFDNAELREAEAFFNAELIQGSAYAVPYVNLAYRKDALKESLWGTHLQVSPFIGTKLGFTTYTALYDSAHFVVPGFNDLRSLLVRDSYYYPKFKMMDAEITGLYSTYKPGQYDRDFRRVIGFDGHTVIGNTSIQGEYAELTVTGEDHKIGDDPKAYLVSAYTQFENLYFLTLFRHYDVDFDNPYSNAFSEHEKFDDTILEKNVYALTNPMLSDVYLNSSQAQPERGVYFETRYKFNNYFTVGRSYLDVFERLTDGRRTARFQSELEFRPLYQLGLRMRYKNQVNRYDDTADRGVSKTNEYTMSVRTFLSNRNFLEFEYRYNTVIMPPYTSLTNPAQPGNNSIAGAMTLMTGDYIGVNYTHNFNKSLKLQGSFIYWFGHGISHWDWEDMEIDFMGEKGSKAWVALHSRISRNMYLSLKFRNKTYQTKELYIRKYNVPIAAENYFERVEHIENTIRIGLDYRF